MVSVEHHLQWKSYLHFHFHSLSPSAGRRWNPNPTTQLSDWASSHSRPQNHPVSTNHFINTNLWVCLLFCLAQFTHICEMFIFFFIHYDSQVVGADCPSVWMKWTSVRSFHARHLSENTPASYSDFGSPSPPHTAACKSVKQVMNTAIRWRNHMRMYVLYCNL